MKGYTIQHSIDLLEKAVENSGGGSGGGGTAADVSYSNTSSGLVATNVQDAIDEIDGKADALTSDVEGLRGFSTYSTEEHVVGKWIDGRDVYEKTISIAALPSASGVGSYSADTENAELCWVKNAILTGGGDVSNIRIDYNQYNDCHTGSLFVRSATESGDVKVYIYVGTDRSSLSAYVTVNYVKTAPANNTRSKKK